MVSSAFSFADFVAHHRGCIDGLLDEGRELPASFPVGARPRSPQSDLAAHTLSNYRITRCSSRGPSRS